MAAKVIESFMHRRNLMYHRCQDWEGSRAFFESIADWLSNIGDSMLADYISATPKQSGDAARIIVDSLSNSPALIVIDDYHKVSDKTLHQTIQAISLWVS